VVHKEFTSLRAAGPTASQLTDFLLEFQRHYLLLKDLGEELQERQLSLALDAGLERAPSALEYVRRNSADSNFISFAEFSALLDKFILTSAPRKTLFNKYSGAGNRPQLRLTDALSSDDDEAPDSSAYLNFVEGERVHDVLGAVELEPDALLAALTRTSKDVKCYNCNKTGHFGRDCPSPRTPEFTQFLEDAKKRYAERAASGRRGG
jgi:hypothetical protein